MRATFAITAAALLPALLGPVVSAQDSYTVEALAEAPPEAIAAPIREALRPEGVRVLDDEGTPLFDFWLRAAVPAEGAVGGPAGAVLYPFLAAGQLVGAVRLGGESYDYKDQSVAPGVYTMRYGLQPVDGNHLGVSTYRDYVMLSLADEDATLEGISQDDLEALSTGASGTNHPSVFLLLPAPKDGAAPAIVRDDAADRTGVVLELPVAPGGAGEATPVPVQVVIQGAGPH